MPIHNWARANEGLFHWFHQLWVVSISHWLNAGRLPEGFYAIGELYAARYQPDVLAVEDRPPQNGHITRPANNGFGLAIVEAAPKSRFTWDTETKSYLERKNLLAIRNVEGTLIAVIEIVSPGNKSSKARSQKFLDKTVDFLTQGIHVLVIDLFPATPRDPHGIHHAIWTEYNGEFEFEPDKPLTLASYMAESEDTVARAYVDLAGFGETLPPVPLFLWPERYINVDLEATYASAWAVYPEPLKSKIET